MKRGLRPLNSLRQRAAIALVSAALSLSSVATARAQGVPSTVKYGKWALVAGSALMNYFAARAHNRAEDAFGELELRCEPAGHAACAQDGEGRYLDPVSESLFQTSLSQDRSARRWLIGGETALVGAAALFVYELTRPKGRPPNIPFEPEVSRYRGSTRIGVGVRF